VRTPAVLICAVLALAGAACGNEAPITDGSKLSVVTAFYPIELAARRIGGAAVQVSNLTPPGGEPHDLELKAGDIAMLRQADLVLYFGRGFQPAVDDAIATLSGSTTVVDLLDRVPLAQAPPDQDELTVDPHIWLSPDLMVGLVAKTSAAMSAKDPEHAASFDDAATVLSKELAGLDHEFETKLATCQRREIFTSHAAFGYLAARYHLRQVAITGLTPEAEPSSRRLQDIARQAREAHATTIFFETLVSPRVSEAVARIVGAKVVVLDPIEGLSTEDAAAGRDYFSVMRTNVDHLVEALSCR
jgi:zinc transport system substrate-binding protein